MRPLSLLASLMAMPLTLTACSNESEAIDSPKVVVTTTWQGMFAAAAGAVDITVIVPPGTPNPSTFDPASADLASAEGADFVLYGESEPFAPRVLEAAGDGADPIAINPDNAVANVVTEVTRLGALFGTSEDAGAWIEEFEAAVAGFKEELDAQVGADEPVVAGTDGTRGDGC